MSCFSCFARRVSATEDTCDAPRLALDRSFHGAASKTYIERAVQIEKYTEVTEVASLEKEVAVQVTEVEYESESEKEIEIDVEKEFHMQARLVRRGVLPSRTKKGKSTAFRNA